MHLLRDFALRIYVVLTVVSVLSVSCHSSVWAQSQEQSVTVHGELKQWYKVTLDVAGPQFEEASSDPNPFTDIRLEVVFAHESGEVDYRVPGYFAADGRSGETSVTAGNVWRAHFAPDRVGTWHYSIHFVRGEKAAVTADAAVTPIDEVDGTTGEFDVSPSDASGRDFRARGRLQYVGKHHLRFMGDGTYFLKAGPDAPETLLAYRDFDNTETQNPAAPLKTWQPHLRDWRDGDPTWKNGKGKGLIGAVNYIATKGLNTVSFLPYNAGGDGDNVWPFISRNDRLHYDCSKLDQWGVVFDHAAARGVHLHFKLQETEMDDNRAPGDNSRKNVPESLDGGELGVERKLYLRELVARFGHALALNWNIGEENTQSTEQIRAMAQYIRDVDPYDHPIVIHTYPNEQDKVYPPLLGNGSVLTGASLQNSWQAAHQRTLHWLRQSSDASRPWVVANDEQNPASMGVPPDPGYQGHSGEAVENGVAYTLDDVRKRCLWGNLMAGGGGVEYYFGYALPQHDLVCEDFRSRDKSWDYCRFALDFFRQNKIPFQRMANADERIGNPAHDNSRYCLTDANEIALVFIPKRQTVHLDLGNMSGKFTVAWFDPQRGGIVRSGTVTEVDGNQVVDLGKPPQNADQDWLIVVRKM